MGFSCGSSCIDMEDLSQFLNTVKGWCRIAVVGYKPYEIDPSPLIHCEANPTVLWDFAYYKG